MNKPAEICITILFTYLLFFSTMVHAEEGDGDDDGDDIIINIDLQGVIDAIFESGNNLGTTITNVPSSVLNVFKDSLKTSVKNFDSPMLSLTEFLLTANPDPEPMREWWETIILIISCFYLLLFLVVGFMFLFSAVDQEKRIKAKEWLKNTLIIVVLVGVSFEVYKLILGLGSGITDFIWITGFEAFFKETLLTEASGLLLLAFGFTIGLTLITLFVRYVFLLIATLLFPIAIFLYFIPPLQNWGKILFNLIGIALFMQFIDVIVFIASNQAALDLAGQTGSELVPALAFLLVGIVNVLMIFYAAIKSALSVKDNSPVLAYAFGALTGQISTLASTLKNVVPKK